MSGRRARTASPSSPPDAAALHEAALAYLARFAATRAGLRRVLERRVDRWARAAEAEHGADHAAEGARAARAAIESVVARLAEAGAVDDAAFAVARAHRLTRAGKSRIAAALTLAARRRIGPFRTGAPPDAAGRLRELGVLARAGFPRDVAERALRLEPADAEARVAALRRR